MHILDVKPGSIPVMPLYQEVSLEVGPRSQWSFSEYTDADTSSAVADSPACGKRLPTNDTGGRCLKTLGEESRILLESLGGLRVAWELGGYVERAKEMHVQKEPCHIFGGFIILRYKEHARCEGILLYSFAMIPFCKSIWKTHCRNFMTLPRKHTALLTALQ